MGNVVFFRNSHVAEVMPLSMLQLDTQFCSVSCRALCALLCAPWRSKEVFPFLTLTLGHGGIMMGRQQGA